MTATSAGRVVALAGGVGAARFLRGLVRVVPPSDLTVIANTGDDLQLHSLHVSPDLDTITYTLGGGVHPEQGWGRADDTLAVSSELAERYGQPAWFMLGDRDLATHLVRTRLLREGHTLTEATSVIAQAWRLGFALLPMTDDPVATRIRTGDGRTLHFQQWWVAERGQPAVDQVWLEGAEQARPTAGALDALEAADAVLLCPSNPVVSISTILALPGIRDVLRRSRVVGISPIISGRVVRGMADRLLPAVGVEVNAAAVARMYDDFLDGWVLDEADADLAGEVAAGGARVAVTDTMMRDVEIAARVAQVALELAAAT